MASHREILRANQRARWKQFFCRSVILVVSLLLVLTVGFWYLWNSPFFALNEILVVKTETIPAERLLAAANAVLDAWQFKLFHRKVNWFYPRQTLQFALKRQFPELAAISISNPAWGVLRIEVEERRRAALWCQEEDCYFMDHTGLLYSRAPQFSNAPLFTLTGPMLPLPIGSRPLSTDDFEKLLDLRTELDQLLATAPDFAAQTIAAVSLEEPVDYIFEVRNLRLKSSGWRLFTARADSPDVIASRFLATFAAPAFLLEYRTSGSVLDSLDLRFRRRVFYKFVS